MSWIAWIYPKSWYRANEINRINREKLVSSLSVGRRFGKTRLASIEVSALVGGEKGRQAAIEFWNKVDRGEI